MKALFIGSTVRNWRRIGLAGEARIWVTGELAYFWMATKNPARKPVEVGSLSHYLQVFIFIYI